MFPTPSHATWLDILIKYNMATQLCSRVENVLPGIRHHEIQKSESWRGTLTWRMCPEEKKQNMEDTKGVPLSNEYPLHVSAWSDHI